MEIVQTFGKIKVVRAIDSDGFKERKTGFVAVTERGTQYYAPRQNAAIAKAINAEGSNAI